LKKARKDRLPEAKSDHPFIHAIQHPQNPMGGRQAHIGGGLLLVMGAFSEKRDASVGGKRRRGASGCGDKVR